MCDRMKTVRNNQQRRLNGVGYNFVPGGWQLGGVGINVRG